MTSEQRSVTLRADGTLYVLECEVVRDGHDWLDALILEACREAVHVERVVRESGLPWRVMEDAVCDLLERADLLIDVPTGLIRRASAASNRRPDVVTRRLWVWQDHATGVILPLERIEEWTKREERPEELRVPGGPPSETLLEMSGARLLGLLERFAPELSVRGARVLSRERIRSEPLRVSADLANGRLRLQDAVPRVLGVRWARVVGEGAGAPPELPRSISALADEWLGETTRRGEELAALHPGALAPRFRSGATEALIGTLTSAPVVALDRRPALAPGTANAQAVVDAIRGAQRRVVIVGPQLADEQRKRALRPRVRDLCALVPEGCTCALVETDPRGLEPRWDLEPRRHAWSRRPSGGGVEFVLVDDKIAFWGGTAGARDGAPLLRLTTRGALLPLLGWSDTDDTLVPRLRLLPSDDARALLEELDAWSAQNLNQIARRRVLPRPSAPTGGREVTDGDFFGDQMLERASDVLGRLHDALGADTSLSDISPCLWMEPDELRSLAAAHPRIRVLARSVDSPLAKTVAARPEASRDALVVVWSTSSPAAGVRWLDVPGPCEVVCVGADVVAVGCWNAPARLDVAPFAVFHAPALCRDLLAWSDASKVSGAVT